MVKKICSATTQNLILGYIKQGDVKNGDSLGIIHLNADNFNLKYYTAFTSTISRNLWSLLNLFLIAYILELRKCDSSAFLHYLSYTRRVVPKDGPIDFASKNQFSLNSADGKDLVPKYLNWISFLKNICFCFTMGADSFQPIWAFWSWF